MVAPLRVGIAGLGTVGAAVVRLIEEQARTLSARSMRRFLESGIETLHNVVPLANRR